MKRIETIKTAMIALLLVVGISSVNASGKIKVEVNEKDLETAVVEIVDSKLSEVEIDLVDAYGENIYSRTAIVEMDKFKTKFNFSKLVDGDYRFTVKTDGEKTNSRFTVKDGEVDIIDSRKWADPYVSEKDERINLTVLNYQYEPINMYVYDSNNQLLFSKNLGSDFTIHYAVNYSELRYGNYEVVLTNAEEVFNYSFSVK